VVVFSLVNSGNETRGTICIDVIDCFAGSKVLFFEDIMGLNAPLL